LSKNGTSIDSASSTPPLNQPIMPHASNLTGPDPSKMRVSFLQKGNNALGVVIGRGHACNRLGFRCQLLMPIRLKRPSQQPL
ncbi:MAG: hypothetical protein ABIR77_04620, partial [Sphingomicrobium sp.]